ncbi:hypothetical protein FEDK69T_26800 [Flavobacterium enshiense DK69]|uniref:DUF1566 domain-containing protein n=1 Tax=Flavobacterium enshiense TaxID=1341165 RepID=UPI0003C62621|nr:DUF1566 domain-containing protein [Flavobacterium enshiense]ESU21123.1 hypothetical protein FEDK69T_26800 [Flavobacterium enshiense DK69]
MKKHLLKSLVLFMAALAVIVSCSKDDATENDKVDQNGGEVFRYQAVTINLNGVDLSQNEYEATFAGEQVILRKSGVNTLVFSVSPNASLGKTDLVISSLNSATIHYDVKDTVLTDTSENTLASFLGNLENYSNQVGASTFPEYQTSLRLVSAFNSFYADADAAQKEVMAKLYKANKASFDYIMMSGINGATGRFTPTEFATVSLDLFNASVAGIVVGVAVIHVADWLVSNPGIFTAVKIVGAVLTGVALGLCAESLRDFLLAKAKAVQLSVSSLFGDNNRNTNSSFISFQNDVSLVTPINTYRRSVDTSDAASDNALIRLFFKSHSIYTGALNTINDAIDYINNYNPLYDIPNVPIRQVSSVSQSEQELMTSEIFQKLALSVNHPNLQLVSSSLQGDGQLNMKIKIIGTPASLPVSSYLNYSYSDEFSSFSGKLPIKVEVVPVLYIGMSYQGGKIAYIYQQGDPGYVQGEQHGLIAAPEDIISINGLIWSNSRSLSGGTDEGLGKGLENTNKMLLLNDNSTYAVARKCSNLVVDGYDDWFLPSKEELRKVYISRSALGGFYEADYWSSTEISSSAAYALDFFNGYNATLDKYRYASYNGPVMARAIRYF